MKCNYKSNDELEELREEIELKACMNIIWKGG